MSTNVIFFWADSEDREIHPDAPAGGAGPGFSRSPVPIGLDYDVFSGRPHPHSPVGMFLVAAGPKRSRSRQITLTNIDQVHGPLTGERVERVFQHYTSSLAGNGAALIRIFQAHGVNGWIGLAIAKQESSFGKAMRGGELDLRNRQNPFSAHFTRPDKFPGCGKNALLVPDARGKYDDPLGTCSVKGYRLPTFEESAEQAAAIVARVGVAGYNRPNPHYESEITERMYEILNALNLATTF